jgi:hypothetical protein
MKAQVRRASGVGRGAALAEVLGRDLVEEFAELLDLVLILVGHRYAPRLEHLLGADDPAADPQRQGDRVGRPRPDGEPAVEDQLGVEDVLADRGRGGTTPCWANAIALASGAPTQIGR